MPETVYVSRAGGVITGRFANPQPGVAEEALSSDDPELVAFGLPRLSAYAADKRWEKETGSITLPGGVIIATDPTSQTKIAAAKTAFDNGTLTGTIKFKAVTGFFDADAAAVTAVYAAVVAHIQACYALEAQVQAEITAGTITTHAEIDAAFA